MCSSTGLQAQTLQCLISKDHESAGGCVLHDAGRQALVENGQAFLLPQLLDTAPKREVTLKLYGFGWEKDSTPTLALPAACMGQGYDGIKRCRLVLPAKI